MTVHGAKVYSDVREVIVPPAKRVLNVEVKPSAEQYKPGAKAKMTVKVTDHTGEPYVGSLVVAMYDKSVEYISGGSNVPDIKEFFWKWRRNHRSSGESSLSKAGRNITKPGEIGMGYLGVFGASVADEMDSQGVETLTQSGNGSAWGDRSGARRSLYSKSENSLVRDMFAAEGVAMPTANAAPMGRMMAKGAVAESADADGGGGGGQPEMAQPTVRTNFADTALWVGEVTTEVDGLGEFELTMPENLTTWKTRVWAMGAGTRVGEGSAESVTTKDLLIRLQAPRFFVQTDEVVLSATYVDVDGESFEQLVEALVGERQPAEHLGPLGHPGQAPAPAARGQGRSQSVVVHDQVQRRRGAGTAPGRPCAAIPRRIRRGWSIRRRDRAGRRRRARRTAGPCRDAGRTC